MNEGLVMAVSISVSIILSMDKTRKSKIINLNTIRIIHNNVV